MKFKKGQLVRTYMGKYGFIVKGEPCLQDTFVYTVIVGKEIRHCLEDNLIGL